MSPFFPAKFGETVETTIGTPPEMPPTLAALTGTPIHCELMAPARNLIQDFIRQHGLRTCPQAVRTGKPRGEGSRTGAFLQNQPLPYLITITPESTQRPYLPPKTRWSSSVDRLTGF